MISDTEPNITRRKHGVINKLQNVYPLLEFKPCRLYVLDLVLKHQLALFFTEKTTQTSKNKTSDKSFQNNKQKQYESPLMVNTATDE